MQDSIDPGDAGPVEDDVVEATAPAGDPGEAGDVGDTGAELDPEMAELLAAEQEQLRHIRGEDDPVADEQGRQRRQNVRVDVQLPIKLFVNGRELVGRTRDVSATGIGFSTRLPMAIEQRGEVLVSFSGWMFRKAFIVRFVKPILAGCQVGVQFDELTQEERERLVKQVFDVQREQLQVSRTR